MRKPYDRCGIKRGPTVAQLYRKALQELVTRLEADKWSDTEPALTVEFYRAQAILRRTDRRAHAS